MLRKILIVDDSAVNRQVLKVMLSDEYLVIEAASGEEAIEILNREYRSISAVLLDIVMPGLDGYGVLSSIRHDKRFSKMPVIMITASDDETTRVKSLELNANDYVRKPYNKEILKHCLQNNIALSESFYSRGKKLYNQKRKSMRPRFNLKVLIAILCIGTLALSLLFQHLNIQNELQKSAAKESTEFTAIMNSYQHSFNLFEMLLQEKMRSGESPNELEEYLKSNDKNLLHIEGEDYDGVYMYYKGKYIYSWDTPYSVYAESGYDATKRPWYIGAVKAKGNIFFSTPYPSYANNYMLATISRLQEDGETVIAYDIKLGEISKFVDRLILNKGTLALICDSEGNIIGSTEHSLLGGNFTLSPTQLDSAIDTARQANKDAGSKEESALSSAKAQKEFVTENSKFLNELLDKEGTLRYSCSDFSLGYAYVYNDYSFFVIAPITTILPQIITLWAALLFIAISLMLVIRKMLRSRHQILSDVLTGLNNRRAFIKYCDNHMLHHSDENIGLLMLDLNHFKKINDLYGHAMGDQALLDAAIVLKSACATSNDNFFLCRYGGDEFLLAARIPDITSLTKMKDTISEGFSRKNQTSVTPYVLEASMGISFGICKDKRDIESLLKQADQTMYKEKKKGGN